MALTTGDYRIHSCYNKTGSRKHVLNLDSGKVTNGTRIYTTIPDGTREQIWYYNKNRLYTEAQDSKYRNTKCLDRLDTSANYADIYDDNDDDNQLITLETVSEYEGIYRIKLTRKNLYLTTSSSTGIGTCTWKSPQADTRAQEWIFERIIRVTNMPNVNAYDGNIEYFSGCTGWRDGNFDDQAYDIRETVAKLYRAVSGNRNNPEAKLLDKQCLYNLPGAIACKQGYLNGYYHLGVDLNFSGSVYPYTKGTIVGYSPSDGAIGIRHTFPHGSFIFWYLHMKVKEGLPEDVDTDTCLGEVSNVSSISIPSHLHIEVQSVFDDEMKPHSPVNSTVYVQSKYPEYFGAFDLFNVI